MRCLSATKGVLTNPEPRGGLPWSILRTSATARTTKTSATKRTSQQKATVPRSSANSAIPITVGLALGDRHAHSQVLDAGGRPLEQGRVALSPAELLARLGRVDAQVLLAGDALLRRAPGRSGREASTRRRGRIPNGADQPHARCKSFGLRLPTCSPDAFHRRVLAHLREKLAPALEPIVRLISQVTAEVENFDGLARRAGGPGRRTADSRRAAPPLWGGTRAAPELRSGGAALAERIPRRHPGVRAWLGRG